MQRVDIEVVVARASGIGLGILTPAVAAAAIGAAHADRAGLGSAVSNTALQSPPPLPS